MDWDITIAKDFITVHDIPINSIYNKDNEMSLYFIERILNENFIQLIKMDVVELFSSNLRYLIYIDHHYMYMIYNHSQENYIVKDSIGYNIISNKEILQILQDGFIFALKKTPNVISIINSSNNVYGGMKRKNSSSNKKSKRSKIDNTSPIPVRRSRRTRKQNPLVQHAILN